MKRKSFIPFGANADHSIDYLLGILEDARITTLARVENISTEELHWQYETGWNTIGALLSHIISCEHFHRIRFLQGRKLTAEEKEIYVPGINMGKYIPQLITDWEVGEYVNQLEISRKKIIEEIQKLKTGIFHEKREGYNPETGFNLAWSCYHLAEDEVHHRGQISIIRKLYKQFIHKQTKQIINNH